MTTEQTIDENKTESLQDLKTPDNALGEEDFDIDSLIPEDLRVAADKSEESDTELEASSPEPIRDVPESDTKEQEIEEDLDLSADAIDRLISGDADALAKKEETTEEVPFWHEDEEYNSLVNRYGISQEEVDKLIEKVSDSKVLENKNYVEGLRGEVEELKRKTEGSDEEVERLRAVEKAAYFDNSVEVKEKFVTPMSESLKEIKNILDLEGSTVSLQKIAGTKSRADLTKVLQEDSFDDESFKKIVDSWRNYREIETNYLTAKEEAQKDLSKYLDTAISDESANNILKNSLADFLKADEKYNYINEGIKQNDEESLNILGLAKNNFFTLLQAFKNPSNSVKNQDWLKNLATFMFDSAHNSNIQQKYYKVNTELEQSNQKLRKLAVEYKKLANSGKGIRGVKRTGVINGHTPQPEGTDADEYKKFLNNELKIDDILP